AAIGAHAWRLRDVADPSLEDLRVLIPQDLDEMSDDDDDLPDLSALQPPSGEPLIAPDDVEETDESVDFGVDAASPEQDGVTPEGDG
ncbi:MAG: hypothetical protein Q4G46_16125, partial [Propionibacteriaceae bacterium]|nr:hypothetical protein [Propionibacteriaceae bacterium]